LRGLLIGRPLFSLGGGWRAVEPLVAADLVVRDGTADLYQGDRRSRDRRLALQRRSGSDRGADCDLPRQRGGQRSRR